MEVVRSDPVRRALFDAGVRLAQAQVALDKATKQAGATGMAALCADLSETVEELQTQVDALLRQPEGMGPTGTQGEG